MHRNIEAAAPPEPLLLKAAFWGWLVASLRARSLGIRDSGAFLLGRRDGDSRHARRALFFDDLAPDSYGPDGIRLSARNFATLWAVCREERLSVVADIHVHCGPPRQSAADRTNPMIAQPGHVAIILPFLARRTIEPELVGLFRYRGGHDWDDLGGAGARRYFGIHG